MRANGLRGASRAKKRFTTHPDPAAVRAPDLVKRDFTAARPNEKWVADFTYCSTWSGVVYVAFIVDVFSRRIVGWKAARSMTAALVVDALNMAAWTRRGVELAGLICHSDAGSQYVSIAYTDRLDDIGASPSIGTVGDSFDNAMAESVIGLFKTELHRNPAALRANGGHWRGPEDIEIATCGWVGPLDPHPRRQLDRALDTEDGEGQPHRCDRRRYRRRAPSMASTSGHRPAGDGRGLAG
jgi:putative transposase